MLLETLRNISHPVTLRLLITVLPCLSREDLRLAKRDSQLTMRYLDVKFALELLLLEDHLAILKVTGYYLSKESLSLLKYLLLTSHHSNTSARTYYLLKILNFRERIWAYFYFKLHTSSCCCRAIKPVWLSASSRTAASAELFIGLQPPGLQWAHSLPAAAAACLRQRKASEGKRTWEEGGAGTEWGWLTFNFYICQHHVGVFSICNSAMKAHRVCFVEACLRAPGLHLALWLCGMRRSEGIMQSKEGNSYSTTDYPNS